MIKVSDRGERNILAMQCMIKDDMGQWLIGLVYLIVAE